MNKVFDAREQADKVAADKKAEKAEGQSDEEALADAPGGSKQKASFKQLFSTSAGLFVKDPILAETQKSNVILTKIKEGIDGLKKASTGSAGGALKFT